MSNRRSHFDISPMVDKVQKDIINLCYLGLHQYAKENKLIGRSRPLLNDGMTPYYIRRLFFRLTVACVQQMISTVEWPHGGRLDQVNYINVGGYKTLRLYGLLDREMFLVDRDKMFPLWQSCVPSADWVHLSQERPFSEIEEFLQPSTRAIIEVGGEHFTKTLRSAMQYVRTEQDVKLHIQHEPKDRAKVRNIAIDLDLYEVPYVGRHGGNWEAVPGPGHNITIPTSNGRLEIPCHIESIIHFRDDIYPFVNSLTGKEVREKFLYLTKNWPSGEAIQIKLKELQMSERERERRRAELEEETEVREGQLDQIRERFRVAFGDQRPGASAANMQEALVEAGHRPAPTPDPQDEDDEFVPCNVCEGDWNQCDCCGECESTDEDCTCWQCGECNEHQDDCVCCEECDSYPCQCLEQEAVLVNPEEDNIELLRRKVHEVLGD